MVPQPRRSEGADRTLAAVLQRAAAAQRPWLQTPGDSSPELVGTQYHSPRTHCLIGYKFHTQVTRNGRRVEVPDSSHDVQLDAPEAVAAAVATGLGGTESGSRVRSGRAWRSGRGKRSGQDACPAGTAGSPLPCRVATAPDGHGFAMARCLLRVGLAIGMAGRWPY